MVLDSLLLAISRTLSTSICIIFSPIRRSASENTSSFWNLIASYEAEMILPYLLSFVSVSLTLISTVSSCVPSAIGLKSV